MGRREATPGGGEQPDALPTRHEGRAAAPEYFTADLRLLADPDTDPPAHCREWRRVYDYFCKKLDSCFRTQVPEKADRDDLIQDIWERAIPGIATLSSPAVFLNWLLRIGNNRLIDLRRREASKRKRAIKHAGEAQHLAEVDVPASVLDELAVDVDNAPLDLDTLRRQLDTLSPSDRALVELKMKGWSHEEIAVELGLPSAAASRQRYTRIKAKLRGG